MIKYVSSKTKYEKLFTDDSAADERSGDKDCARRATALRKEKDMRSKPHTVRTI